MSTQPLFEHDELMRRISRDLADGYDEELEMEIEDRHPLPGTSTPAQNRLGRRTTGATISGNCSGCRPNW